ncbi:MAG: PAS domain S-box protein [Acidobacteriota bacterium]|jgi:diguanylate cyclase (GGDEF)-like protein/PAS domain S-box-containing protein
MARFPDSKSKQETDRRRPAEPLDPAVRSLPPGHLLLDDPAGLRDFVEEMDEAIYMTDADGAIVDGNPALIRLLGARTLDEIARRRIADFMVDPDLRREFDRRVAAGKANSGLEFRIRGLDGKRRWVRDVAHGQRNDTGETVAYRGVLMDVTEHKRTLRALLESEEKYRAIFENVQDIYYRSDMTGTIVEVSPAVRRYLGYERDELIGRNADDLYPNPADRELLRNRILTDGEVTGFEIQLERKDGNLISFSVNARLLVDDHGQPVGFEGLLRDITDRKDLERRLEELSVRDPLTGCYNRRYLESMRSRLERPTARWGCLLLDLDNFKAVNDTYGHEEGDRVLQGVAHFIRRHGRAEDVVIRLGGDEFAIFVAASSSEELNTIAERLREVAPFESPAPFSLGTAFRELGENIEQVVARADRDMYSKKGLHLRSAD